MSFLVLPTNPLDMSKATISLWFRVPQSTVDKVAALVLPRGGAYGYSEPNTWPVLQKIATLLSWGQQVQGTVWWWTQQQVGTRQDTFGGPGVPTYSSIPTDQQTGSMAPSYIGLDFSGDAAPVRITVNLQSRNKPSFTNYIFALTTWNVEFIGTPGVSGYLKETKIHTDATYTLAFPLTVGAATGPGVPNIQADTWHHLLISWDLTGQIACGGDSLTINSSFKMYFALDDKSYQGTDLPANWIGDVINNSRDWGGNPGFAGTDPYTIVTTDQPLNRLPWPADPGTDEMTSYSNPLPAGSFSGNMGRLSAQNLCVPGFPSYTDDNAIRGPINSIYPVEMAELQIFTGVMLNTSQVSNRRVFVDSEGKPVNPKAAETLLGRPQILLHKSSKWQAGENHGSLGSIRDDEGNETLIPLGQFHPTGKIDKYKPDPSLKKP